MKRQWRVAAAGVAAFGLFSFSSPAGAVPPANTGFDDLPDVVVGGGSDTTHLLSGDLTLLYSRGPGCPLVTSQTDPNKGKCQPAAVPPAGNITNWDHDAFTEAAPAGSSAGVLALTTGPQYNPPIDYARSSRGPQGTELSNTTFWGYAQDGIAVYAMGNRPAGNISGTTLYGIYNCTVTNWNQIPGYTGPAGPIFPYGINPASGTYASFRDYVRVASGIPGFDPNAQSCVRKVAGADGINGNADDVYAFENDLKIQLEDKGPDNTANTADDNDDNKFTWSSASILSFPFLLQSGSPWAVDGVAPKPGTIFSQAYPINRTVNHVTRSTDADCRAVPGSAGPCDVAGPQVTGADTGKGGAVREFTRFLCRTSNTQHQINPVTGFGYKSEINAIISANGFTQVPVGLRTPGYACRVQT